MAVTTVDNYSFWPLLADTFHNPFNVRNDLFTSWALARSQYCGDQFATAPFIHMQMLIAGLLMITVEQSQLLIAVNNIISIIKIQDNDLGRLGIRSEKMIHKVRLVIPFFDDFRLDVLKMGEAEKVKLSWGQKGSDFPMQPYHLSDCSIRFICLATALLQPFPPSAIVIDEPELGLHPEAIRILGELIQDAAKRTQIIVATQSPLLLDQFSIEDIVVVNRKEGQSTFERLNLEDFNEWLNNYSVGELWSKNVIQGGTSYA